MKSRITERIVCRLLTLALLCAGGVFSARADEKAKVERNVTVYQEAGRFGGWPANHGIWSWGDEILVGFSAAYYKKRGVNQHQYDPDKPEEPRLARSLDGGATWKIEAPRSLLPPEQGGKALSDLKEPMNFANPDFVMTIRFTGIDTGYSRLFYSNDRGKNWHGAYNFPTLGMKGIAARTDYVVNGPKDAIVFLTASKSNNKEGRPFAARTTDGGLTWKVVSYIGPEPAGFAIMPSSLRLSPTHLLSAIRCKEGARDWIDLYESKDDGATWNVLSRPVPFTGGHSGNPPSMIRLKDGRLCLTYGYRGEPYGIRARLSKDGGATWGEDIVLRDDAQAWDLGYTRTVQRPDGKIVTVYYFAPTKDLERDIRATIWDAGAAR